MVPFNYTEFIDGLTFLVNHNFIPMTRIDDAVKRILRVKFTMGLFESPLADYNMTKCLGSQVSFSISFYAYTQRECSSRADFIRCIKNLPGKR